MSGRCWMRYFAAVSILAALACGDYTAPTSPNLKKINRSSPAGASFSRYILISGVWTCVDACDDDTDPDAKGEGLPPTVDSVSINAPSPDSVSINTPSPDSVSINAPSPDSVSTDAPPPGDAP